MGDLVRIVKDQDENLYSANDANLGNSLVHTNESKLVYDSKTKVVYYCFKSSYCKDLLGGVDSCGFMSPYISENGKVCRFINNQIVEIG